MISVGSAVVRVIHCCQDTVSVLEVDADVEATAAEHRKANCALTDTVIAIELGPQGLTDDLAECASSASGCRLRPTVQVFVEADRCAHGRTIATASLTS